MGPITSYRYLVHLFGSMIISLPCRGVVKRGWHQHMRVATELRNALLRPWFRQHVGMTTQVTTRGFSANPAFQRQPNQTGQQENLPLLGSLDGSPGPLPMHLRCG
jgi:hypothetical protein